MAVEASQELVAAKPAKTSQPGPIRRNIIEYGELAAFTVETLRALPGALRYTSEVLRQTAILVRGSTFVIMVLTFLMGFVQTNFGYYFLQAAGASDYIGLVSGAATPRGTAAFVFGYIFAAKVGCGLCSELGAMRINEELDAYDAQGVGATRYVIATRVIAALVYIPIVVGLALLACTFGSYINAVDLLHAVPAETFYRFHWGNQNVSDQLFALITMSLMAMAVIFVSTFYGSRVSGGPAAVGRAVARSLMMNLVLVNIISGACAWVFYPGADFKLPIGG
jgi:phospholipid/cholesterol/gamma-HCH transport system permease protein